MTITCLACDDELTMPVCWRHAPIGGELMRLHLDQCESVDRMASALITQTERHLQQCPYVRLGGPGVKYRCQRFGCTGEHQMERES